MAEIDGGTRLRAAVIGTGKIAEQHLGFLCRTNRSELAAVCDLSTSLAEFAAKRFKVPATFSDYRRMLQDVRPDVVHVLTPAHTHVEIANDCLEAGSHVIVEKPIALSRAEFRELWSVAQRFERCLIEDHNYRFNEPVLAIERLVEEGELGDIFEVDVRLSLRVREPGSRYADANLPHRSHRLPAGVIHEFLTHLCYLVLRFAPALSVSRMDPPERLAVAWSNHRGGDLFRYDDLDALLIGGPVHARIRFSSATSPESFLLIVRGSRGTATTDLFLPFLGLETPRRMGDQLSPVANQLLNGWNLVKAAHVNFIDKIRQKTPYEGMFTFLERTYKALQGEGEVPVSFEDMDDALGLAELLFVERNRI